MIGTSADHDIIKYPVAKIGPNSQKESARGQQYEGTKRNVIFHGAFCLWAFFKAT